MRITMGRPETAVRGMSNPLMLPDGNDPQHSLISAAYQLICIIALRSSWSWMTASISNGNVRRRTSSCRCVSRLRSQMLYFKQAGFPPTTITYQ